MEFLFRVIRLIQRRPLMGVPAAMGAVVLLAGGVVANALIDESSRHWFKGRFASLGGDSTSQSEPSLSGGWEIHNVLERTAYSPYKNMALGYRVIVTQSGNRLEGKGEKLTEFGRLIPPGPARTAIRFYGTVSGTRIIADFQEDGAIRQTTGRFEWNLRDSDSANGTFTSSAADSSGPSQLRRVSSTGEARLP